MKLILGWLGRKQGGSSNWMPEVRCKISLIIENVVYLICNMIDISTIAIFFN